MHVPTQEGIYMWPQLRQKTESSWIHEMITNTGPMHHNETALLATVRGAALHQKP